MYCLLLLVLLLLYPFWLSVVLTHNLPVRLVLRHDAAGLAQDGLHELLSQKPQEERTEQPGHQAVVLTARDADRPERGYEYNQIVD